MATCERRESGLSSVRGRLERWRLRHGGPGRPIPEELWDQMVAVARKEGVSATSRALRVSAGQLGRRMESASVESRSDEVEATGASGDFVELDASVLCAPGRSLVRFVGRDGERLEVELTQASRIDVVALARAFWERGT